MGSFQKNNRNVTSINLIGRIKILYFYKTSRRWDVKRMKLIPVISSDIESVGYENGVLYI